MPHSPLKKIANSADETSLAARFRQGRMVLFQSLLDQLQKPLALLDVGGSQQFWQRSGFLAGDGIEITVLNLAPVEVSLPNFRSVVGDARRMTQFDDQQFDVVFSNSVIEHLGSLQAQQMMAQEVKRVGKRYFIQTPNKYFPLEPHFLFPFFQFLPVELRAHLLRRFDLGWVQRIDDYQAAKREVQSIHLLSKNDFCRLFAEGHLWEEKVLGLTKSFVMYHGWA